MSAEAVVDAEVVDEVEVGSALERREATSLSVTPQVQASELVERLANISTAMQDAMCEGVDYGKIPGTDKPTLLKPGAEKLGVLFQLDIQIDVGKTWGPGDHLTVVAKATAYHAPTGARLGYGEGICTTRERKYAYRNAQRVCPSCGVPAIIKGKQEYGGGWVCFDKKGGCKAKFRDGAAEIEDQTVSEIENPDLPDLWNTVVKMAEKRARVDAVLAVTGASALFTQDAEDLPAANTPQATADSTKPVSPFGPVTSNERLLQVRAAIGYLLNVDHTDEKVTLVLREIAKEANGYLPEIASAAVCRTARMVKEGTAQSLEEQPPDASSDDPYASEFTKTLGDDHAS
jgi:hypothetical protein